MKFHKILYVLLKFSQNRPNNILFSSRLKKCQGVTKRPDHLFLKNCFKKDQMATLYRYALSYDLIRQDFDDVISILEIFIAKLSLAHQSWHQRQFRKKYIFFVNEKQRKWNGNWPKRVWNDQDLILYQIRSNIGTTYHKVINILWNSVITNSSGPAIFVRYNRVSLCTNITNFT